MNVTEHQIFVENKAKDILSLPQGYVERFQRMYKPFFFIPSSLEDINNLSIKLEYCLDKQQIEKWESMIQFQSVHCQRPIPGRNLRILVHNEYNNSFLGVIRLTQCLPRLPLIDKHIGWTEEIKWRGAIQKINNVQALVPCQPFGFNCLGGKLLMTLSATKEITDKWEELFGEKLYALYTLSMTAGLNQYSGVRQYKSLGHTDGEISRGVYFCSLYDNAVELLKEIDTIPICDKRQTVSEMVSEWKPKAIARMKKLISNGRLKTAIETYDNLYKFMENPFFG